MDFFMVFFSQNVHKTGGRGNKVGFFSNIKDMLKRKLLESIQH